MATAKLKVPILLEWKDIEAYMGQYDIVEVVRCKDCKHNPSETWFECPMSHLNENQRPETAWCWKGESLLIKSQAKTHKR